MQEDDKEVMVDDYVAMADDQEATEETSDEEEEDEEEVFTAGGWLPGWAYNRHAAMISSRMKDSHPEQLMEGVAPPALPYAYAGAAILWCYFFVSPWLSVFAIRSEESCPVSGKLPQVPKWIYLSYLPFLLVSLALEFKTVQHIAPAHAILGRVKLGCLHPPYIVFYLMTLGLSALARADMLTNSLFAAKVWVASECSPTEFPPYYAKIVAFGWLLMVGQLVYAIMETYPLGDPVQGPKKKFQFIEDPTWNTGYRFKVLAYDYMAMEDILYALADCGRMQSVLYRSFSFQAFDMGVWRAVSLLGVLQGKQFRFVVYLLGETIPQIWAQVFILTVSYSLSGVLDHQTLASILLSCFFAAKGIYGEAQKVEKIHHFRRGCSDPVPCATMDKIFKFFRVIIGVTALLLSMAVVQLIRLLL